MSPTRSRRFPNDPQSEFELAGRLQDLLDLARFDRPDDPGGWNLVHSMSSIDESCRTLTEQLLPKLGTSTDAAELKDVLTDIGGELQHLAYHIADARYFGCLGIQTPANAEDATLE